MACDVLVLRRNDFTIDGRVERQASSLAQKGLHVSVLALGGSSLPRTQHQDGYTVERVPVDAAGAMATPWLGRLRSAFGTALYYEEAIRRIVLSRPRVVHCHDLDTLMPGLIGARRVGARVIYDSAELWVERNSGLQGLRKRWDQLRYRAMERMCIGSADAVVTVSDGIADELAAQYSIKRPRLIRNVPRRPSPDLQKSLRERVGGEGPIVLHLGIVDMNRGLEESVRALAHVDNARLVLLGTAREYVLPALMQLAREVGVADRVIHLPPVPRDEIVAWAADADAALCTFLPVCLSHILAMPNKLFEYAFAGVPIVASDLPDMGNFVRQHGLGAVCDPQQPADIARAINAVLSGEVARRSAEQISRFVDQFAWEREFETLWQIYTSLLEQH